jgi:transcriptional regulator with XRE-family HTH domain
MMKGNQMKTAREQLGLTQVRMAEELGMHPNTIARFERDELEIPRYIELAVEALVNRGKPKITKKKTSTKKEEQ